VKAGWDEPNPGIVATEEEKALLLKIKKKKVFPKQIFKIFNF